MAKINLSQEAKNILKQAQLAEAKNKAKKVLLFIAQQNSYFTITGITEEEVIIEGKTVNYFGFDLTSPILLGATINSTISHWKKDVYNVNKELIETNNKNSILKLSAFEYALVNGSKIYPSIIKDAYINSFKKNEQDEFIYNKSDIELYYNISEETETEIETETTTKKKNNS